GFFCNVLWTKILHTVRMQLDYNFVGTKMIWNGASLNKIKRTVKFLCPAEIIPPYIEVDLSLLDVGQKLVAGDLKVHPALKLIRPKDKPIVKIALTCQ
ncbi:unnamed protein product, partial [Brassica rapa subsp. trilocularis]